jgi:hypothetical protein
MALESEFHVIVLQEPKRLYRGCHGTGRTALEASLTSNFQAGRSPHPAGRRATVLHMAVSMFEEFEVVAGLARHRPERIGTYVAQVDLRPGHGVCVASTSGPGHWSVWGIPAQLADFVTDVREV